MLYREFKERDLECQECPLFMEDICPGGYRSDHNGNPIEPPCCNFDDDTDMYEQAGIIEHQAWAFEEEIMRQHREEQAKIARNKIAQERRREARLHVLDETREIKRLRRRILCNENVMNLARSLADAFNFTNEAFRYTERIEIKPKNALEIENEECQQRIEELEAIKKQKLAELRKARKNDP